MKIFFSPSEGKTKGGENPPICSDSFIFSKLYDKRVEVLDTYHKFLHEASFEELSKLFGLKDKKLVEYYNKDISTLPTKKAIQRYDGVAYDYLKYDLLDDKAQDYIDKNCLIFSNLFGVVRACDKLPEYRLKQGEKIGGFEPSRFYREYFSKSIDEYLADEDVLDLRAGFYSKFYTPKVKTTILKFLKNQKVVSHWAKAYRGIVLREIAKANIYDMDEFLSMELDGLVIKEITKKGRVQTIIFEIV